MGFLGEFAPMVLIPREHNPYRLALPLFSAHLAWRGY